MRRQRPARDQSIRVQVEENHSGQPGKTFVPIDQGVVASDGLQQHGRFQREGGVGILPEDTRSGTRNCRVEQTEVADRTGVEDGTAVIPQGQRRSVSWYRR